ncbi:MarR family winged helix-turn-helix transcriptional regulator [Microbacterium sp. NPDC089696]|uniref:MarR family winged helix-turn-helix transcriptional regulator n=1 Tax=Microbacterium sp. NPDC089696 TaxID=3364199 RepID=UPI003806B747
MLTAWFAIGTWGTSTRFREQLMADAQFPLEGDVPAFLVINQLIYRGVARPTDLADAIDTGKSNISKLVARLESAGLVTRVADPSDNRAVVVALTRNGRDVARRILDATHDLNSPSAGGWTKNDEKELGRLLVKLATAMDASEQHPLSSAAGVTFY